MRIYLIILLWYGNALYAQKPTIGPDTYRTWPSLEYPNLSGDGKFVTYAIKNVPLGKSTVVIQETEGNWKREFIGNIVNAQFTDDSKYLLFRVGKDSVGILNLGTKGITYLTNIFSYYLKHVKNDNWLCYYNKNASKVLHLKNLKTNQEKTFSNVIKSELDNNSTVIFLWKELLDSPERVSLNSVDLESGKALKLWEGANVADLTIDNVNKQLSFIYLDSIYYYKAGFAKVISIRLSGRPGYSQPVIKNLVSFSKNGEGLFIKIEEKKEQETSRKDSLVEIWSYNDLKLPSEQTSTHATEGNLAILDLKNCTISKLQQQANEQFFFPKFTDTIALIFDQQRPNELWNIGHRHSWSLISIKSGGRKSLDISGFARISPLGKYIIYYDSKEKDYFSYQISTGVIRNLTNNLKVSWIDTNRDDLISLSPRGLSNEIWLNEDDFFLMYDKNDIWKIDPLNNQKAINLTNGFGKKNHIVFDFALQEYLERGICSNKIYLTALNKETKDNGFFVTYLDRTGDPELLSTGSYIYKSNSGYVPDGSDFQPLKAKNSEKYIVRRMSPDQAPNYFSTANFKTFTKLSHLAPEKKYNWYKTELHTWISLDGTPLQGVLYKPEDFDPNKKYPVIFHYYERKSDGLNAYISPECSFCNIDIPMYVSQGYLVFTPDIYYKIGDPMQGTYDAVISAAAYLSKFSYVNNKKLGIQGCSFGGLETNYLVTHTNIFSAAVSSSSISDLVSIYGGLTGSNGDPNGGGASLQSYYEFGQIRIGGSLWERPEIYVKNSAIFGIHKITTPILLMHGKKDGICSFSNILEFYLGLRRMGKTAWLLAYPEAGHGLGGKEAYDFSLRMLQFFDYYLKDKSAPLWMFSGTNPLIANDKKNFSLNNTESIPKRGILTVDEQRKADSLLVRKPIYLELK